MDRKCFGIYKRRVYCQKKYEEVCSILKQTAHAGKFEIENDHFSLVLSRRSHMGKRERIFYRVHGTLLPISENETDVIFDIQGGFAMVLGIALVLWGVIGFLANLLFDAANNDVVHIFTVVMGLVTCIFPWAEGIEIVDLLEHILTRQIQE